MTSPDSHGSERLAELLATALQRSVVRAWLKAEDESALDDPAGLSPRAVVLLGRLIRATDLSAEEERALDEWLERPLCRSEASWEPVLRNVSDALTSIESEASSATPSTVTLATRDDIESTLCALGRAVLAQAEDTALGRAERALLERAAALDEVALDAARDLPASFRIYDPWLLRAAGFDPSRWWLDPIAVLELRQRIGRLHWPEPKGPRAPIRFSKRNLERPQRPIPDVIGCEDDLAQVGESFGTLVARLFDGEVEVLAIGLREGDDFEPGLCVRRAGGGDAGIEAVSSREIASSRGAAGWWVPLSAITGPVELVVRLRDVAGPREEQIRIELDD
ncbi:MAG: hypothetical protein WDO74_12255 [Pseudomonadota bacterium]